MIYSLLTILSILFKLASSTFNGPLVTNFAGYDQDHNGNGYNGYGTNVQFALLNYAAISPDLKYALISDSNQIRKLIRSTGLVSLYAGNPNGDIGSTNNIGTRASFNAPYGIVFSPDRSYVLVVDGNHQIRKIDLSTRAVSLYAGDPAGNFGINNGFGTNSQFNYPTAIDISRNGEYALVTDFANNQIRKIILSTREVSVYAGNVGGGYGTVAGFGTNALLNSPLDISISPDNTYALVADTSNSQIRKINLATSEVTLFAGRPNTNYGPENGIGSNAYFSAPYGIDICSDGKYALVADTNNHQIRKIIITTAEVSLFAGDVGGSSGDSNGIGTNANFYNPVAVSISPTGRSALVPDQTNNQLRKIQILAPPHRPALR